MPIGFPFGVFQSRAAKESGSLFNMSWADTADRKGDSADFNSAFCARRGVT